MNRFFILAAAAVFFLVAGVAPCRAGDVLIETYKGEVITAKRIVNLGEFYRFRYKGNQVKFPVKRMQSLECMDERGNGRMVMTRKDGKSFEFTGSNAGIVSDWKQGHYSTIRYEYEDEVTESVAKSWIKSDKVRTIRFR
ncbi:hypothetical protein [Pseudodesulfovibrio indicus]|uniref:Uncharacterized protein n=1 Tax=Pseudodesulfovibrio indicus TaxID=1716143 RepID=A0A126QLQ1_9BACT|nr:hypothetical protein [Pseudodesulfovibrio indicus]AMK10902.1 hypothetical protein AWY79_07160 [Pseudodesulfovibrio indicus]TDT91894.1 hypothetical protein EDC59_101297 [Pseudodesulfovibrio indicus]